MIEVNAQEDTVMYSFFSAGHTYGSPDIYQVGLHTPFVDYIPKINAYPKIQLGFLTGDVVKTSNVPYWDAAEQDIAKLDVPVFIAAGNHDMGSEFVKRFNNYYYSFVKNNDLFIVLTPGLGAWNITGDQLDFLTSTLDNNYSNVNHIFIFLHELIWWSPTNEYSNVIINSKGYYPGSTNFESVVKPLLRSYPKDVTIFAGDLGASTQVSSFMYSQTENITLIGSGMGGGFKDNIIITDVYRDSVYHKLIAINGPDSTALGDFYDYSILSKDDTLIDYKVRVYPSPARDIITVENNFPNHMSLIVSNIKGQVIYVDEIKSSSNNTINVEHLTPGLYIVNLFNDQQNLHYKILIK